MDRDFLFDVFNIGLTVSSFVCFICFSLVIFTEEVGMIVDQIIAFAEIRLIPFVYTFDGDERVACPSVFCERDRSKRAMVQCSHHLVPVV